MRADIASVADSSALDEPVGTDAGGSKAVCETRISGLPRRFDSDVHGTTDTLERPRRSSRMHESSVLSRQTELQSQTTPVEA